MNISNLIRFNTINVDEVTADTEKGSGTFTNLLEKVYSGVISAMVNNRGDIIGIRYVTEDGNDSIEELKFKKAYEGKPVQEWAMKALEFYQNHESYDHVEEAYNDIAVVLDDGSLEVISGYNDEVNPEIVTLPERVKINFNDDDYEGWDDMDNAAATMFCIKKYLRDKFDHYLSGEHDNPDYEIDLDEEVINVWNIHWGRKR